MHRASTEPNYVGGLIALPQADIPDRDSTGQEPAGAHRQQRWTPQNFRNQVQYVLLQGSADQEQRPGSVRNSPAFSDTTLVGGDYLDVPTHDYEEVDLGNYVEYFDGYYGPEPRSLSPTPSTKASFGPEVHSVPDSDLSPGGLYVDDPFTNISYLGSEGKLQEDLPQEPRNFKPIILGWRFLSALFFTLAVLVALAELGIQLLPNESGIATPSHANTTEIRVRSVIHDRSSYLALFERQNDTAALDGNSASSTVTSRLDDKCQHRHYNTNANCDSTFTTRNPYKHDPRGLGPATATTSRFNPNADLCVRIAISIHYQYDLNNSNTSCAPVFNYYFFPSRSATTGFNERDTTFAEHYFSRKTTSGFNFIVTNNLTYIFHDAAKSINFFFNLINSFTPIFQYTPFFILISLRSLHRDLIDDTSGPSLGPYLYRYHFNRFYINITDGSSIDIGLSYIYEWHPYDLYNSCILILNPAQHRISIFIKHYHK
ncbi:hypothetical protein GGR52DRAFT_567972 [Hypoxylon sp. FL1284]|nr:hypothetical protein GGR52DRAFT_567972 [Hypoxylon sp. FL1284]